MGSGDREICKKSPSPRPYCEVVKLKLVKTVRVYLMACTVVEAAYGAPVEVVDLERIKKESISASFEILS
jgi:hypothetical protein